VVNLYSITTNQAAIIALFRVMNRYVGNLAPMPSVFPDYKAPIVRNGAEGRELATAGWGMPASSKALMDATEKRAEKLQAKGKPVDFKELLRMELDGGTTNICNVTSKHWTLWLARENRCVVPFNSFSEFNEAEGGDVRLALEESRPLACFAGIWTNWTSVRKVKEGETTNAPYAFLTTEPNAEVGAIKVTDVQPNYGWRHLWREIVRGTKMKPELCDYMCGHESRSGTGARYGKRKVPVLAKEMALFPRFKVPALNRPPVPTRRTQAKSPPK
jgi:putative SOS response-associated peptidase YedK